MSEQKLFAWLPAQFMGKRLHLFIIHKCATAEELIEITYCSASIIGIELTQWVNNCRAIRPRARLCYPQKLPPLPPTRAAAKGHSTR